MGKDVEIKIDGPLEVHKSAIDKICPCCGEDYWFHDNRGGTGSPCVYFHCGTQVSLTGEILRATEKCMTATLVSIVKRLTLLESILAKKEES
jgi:hypothetical protein